MPLIRTAAPALEPVTLAEAKAHLRVTDTAEDVLIGTLISTARETIEARIGRALITQGWSLWLDGWPVSGTVLVPLAPVRAITAVRVFAADHTSTVVPAADWFLDAVSRPARLVRTASSPWPAPGRSADGVEIAFTAGHGDLPTEVPADLRQAVLTVLATLYEAREGLAAALPPAALDLIAPWREPRL